MREVSACCFRSGGCWGRGRWERRRRQSSDKEVARMIRFLTTPTPTLLLAKKKMERQLKRLLDGPKTQGVAQGHGQVGLGLGKYGHGHGGEGQGQRPVVIGCKAGG